MSAEGIGPAVRALRYWERRQEVMANNLANVSTPGFKAERVFAQLLQDGGPVAQTSDDLSGGSLSETGRPLDIALESDGFLVVETPSGERYMRGGSFHLDEGGKLVTEQGHPVLGTSGPLVLPPGKVVVEKEGHVEVNGVRVGRFRVVRPDQVPGREGANLWVPRGEQRDALAHEVRMRQGHLEESNVDPVSAMVDMIEIQRAYSALQRTIQTHDGVMHTITTEVGRVDG